MITTTTIAAGPGIITAGIGVTGMVTTPGATGATGVLPLTGDMGAGSFSRLSFAVNLFRPQAFRRVC